MRTEGAGRKQKSMLCSPNGTVSGVQNDRSVVDLDTDKDVPCNHEYGDTDTLRDSIKKKVPFDILTPQPQISFVLYKPFYTVP